MQRVLKYFFSLGVCLAASAAAAGWVAARSVGSTAYLASGIGAAVVWIAGGSGLLVIANARDPQQGVSAVLLAMLLRMALPLGAGIALGRPGGPLADYGVFGLIVIHYLVALAVETPLTLRLLHAATANSDPPASGSA